MTRARLISSILAATLGTSLFPAIGAFAQSGADSRTPPAAAEGDTGLPDISGIYRTSHPDDRLGSALIQFAPSAAGEYSVSLWRDEEDGRKIRDGLFGSYTSVALSRLGGGLSLLWRSAEGAEETRNDILSISGEGDIEIAGAVPGSGGALSPRRLEYLRPPDLPDGIGELSDIEGVYDYYHASTGRVLVAFAKAPAASEAGRFPGAYSVRIVRDLGESRFAVVREGLYGGSRPRDEYGLVSIERSGADRYLVWRNPGRPKESRRNRIVCLYPSGDIGIGLDQGERKYVQDTLFRKIAGPEAIIGDALGFMSPEGYFEAEIWPSVPGAASWGIVRIAPTASMLGDRRLYRLEAADLEGGIARIRGEGTVPGTNYGYMAFSSESGLCRVAFIDIEAGREESFAAVESMADGSFALRRDGGETGLRLRPDALAARFTKIAGLEEYPLEPIAADEKAALSVAAAGPAATAASSASAGLARIAVAEDAAWTGEEQAAIESALASLPPGCLSGKPVSILRDPGLFLLGSGREGGALVETSVERRELRVKRLEVAEGFPGDPSAAAAAYLERSAVRSLSLLAFDSLEPELKREWKAFNGWKASFLSPPSPLNQNAEGFADELARSSPAQDFAAFAEDVFLAPSGLDPMSFARFKLPDRYAFFRKLFPSLPAEPPGAGAEGPMPRAETFRDILDPAEIEGVDLVVTTPTSTSIESIAGHVLLLIKRRGDYEDCGDSIALGFVGEISRDSANGIRGLSYVYRGLTGYYRSLIQVETFADLVRRATLVENRDVFRLRLKLDAEEIERLVERLWVVDRAFTYKYYFFSGNCVSMLLDALNYAFVDGPKAKIRGGIAAPMYAVAELARLGRIEGFSHPERWSVLKSARYATDRNRAVAREMIGILEGAARREAGRGGLGPAPAAAALEEARRLLDILFDQGQGAIVEDPLFRVPVIAATGPDRGAAYLRLASLCEELFAAASGPSPVLEEGEYARLVELTERFLLGAVDRELYIAVPPDTRKRYGKGDLALIDSPRDIIERRLYRIRSRQENSTELRAIRLAVSSLRMAMEERGLAGGLYTLGKAMSEERDRSIAKEREGAAFTQGYFERRLAASWAAGEGGSEAGLELETALYRGEMGDASVCALKRDMKLVILGSSLGAYLGLEGFPAATDASSLSLRGRSVAFDFDKIATGDDVDYSGFANPGFGFTLLRSEWTLWDGAAWFPDEGSRTTFVEARGLLNVFEVDDFRHYLNLGLGVGLQRSREGGAAAWGAAVPALIEAKFGSARGELRVSSVWEFRFPEDGLPASRLGFSLDGSLAMSRRSNAVLGLRAYLGLDFSHDASGMTATGRDMGLSCVVKLR